MDCGRDVGGWYRPRVSDYRRADDELLCGPSSDDRELCWGYVSGYVEGAVAAAGGSAPANKCYEGTQTAIAVFHGINKLAQTRDLSGAKPSVVVDQA